MTTSPTLPFLSLKNSWLFILRPPEWCISKMDYLKPFDTSWIDRPIFARFELIADHMPDKIAVDDGVVRFTYREVQQAARHLAVLIEATVPIGRPVGIFLPNSAPFPIAALACLAASRIFVPIDQSYPPERNDQIIREAGLAAVIVERTDEIRNSVLGEIHRLDLTQSLNQGKNERILASQIDGPAVVLYTSGSTGRPKGICNDQRAISQRVADFTTTCRINSADSIVLLSSPGTIAGIRDTFVALLNGAALHVADPYRLGTNGVLGAIRDNEITICYGVPALLRELLRLPMAKLALSSLKVLRFGGDSVLASDIALCRAALPHSCSILIGFGSTEVPTIFQWMVPASWTPDRPTVPCGFPSADLSILLKTEEGFPAAPGDVAEIIVKSRYVALGIWQNGQLDSGPIEVDQHDRTLRIMQTGDLVRLRDDGLVELIGRKDRQLKIKGFRIDPGDVESVLSRCDDVTDVVVTGESFGAADILVAYVVPGISDTSSILERLHGNAERLPRHMRPTRIYMVKESPRLPSFKPDIKKLQGLERLIVSNPAQACLQPNPPATEREVKILSICRQLLKCEDLSLVDNFMESGGDSLSAMALMLEIQSELGFEISLDSIFKSRSIAELCAVLYEQAESALAVVLPVKSGMHERTLYFTNTQFQFSALSDVLPGDIATAVVTINGTRLLRQLMDGGDALAAVDRISSEFARAIFAEHGREPCYLAGYSFAGILALETACKLEKLGAAPGIVFLFDTFLHRSVGRAFYDIRYNGLLADKLKEALLGNREFIRKWARFLARKTGYRLMQSEISKRANKKAEIDINSIFRNLREEGAQAYVGPKRPPASHIVLFKATKSKTGRALRINPDLGWARQLRANLTVVRTRGDHYTILSREFANDIAGEIERQIAARENYIRPLIDCPTA
jgi:acyl-coenzyme A synthetase/AMP-(fatty) acid ligase/thioesterase domain-containing protein/acyl carrier protein